MALFSTCILGPDRVAKLDPIIVLHGSEGLRGARSFCPTGMHRLMSVIRRPRAHRWTKESYTTHLWSSPWNDVCKCRYRMACVQSQAKLHGDGGCDKGDLMALNFHLQS